MMKRMSAVVLMGLAMTNAAPVAAADGQDSVRKIVLFPQRFMRLPAGEYPPF